MRDVNFLRRVLFFSSYDHGKNDYFSIKSSSIWLHESRCDHVEFCISSWPISFFSKNAWMTGLSRAKRKRMENERKQERKNKFLVLLWLNTRRTKRRRRKTSECVNLSASSHFSLVLFSEKEHHPLPPRRNFFWIFLLPPVDRKKNLVERKRRFDSDSFHLLLVRAKTTLSFSRWRGTKVVYFVRVATRLLINQGQKPRVFNLLGFLWRQRKDSFSLFFWWWRSRVTTAVARSSFLFFFPSTFSKGLRYSILTAFFQIVMSTTSNNYFSTTSMDVVLDDQSFSDSNEDESQST